jgi:predicted dehydrogenase
MNRKFNTVFLGAGTIASFHAAAILRASDKFRLAAVGDIDLKVARKIAAPFKAKCYTDCFKMLKKESPGIALISLPHLLHLEYGLAALEAGWHLLLEKPMAISTAHCVQLINASKKADRHILVGHTHRFRSHFKKAAQLIKEGAIGDLRMIFDEASSYYEFENRPAWFMNQKLAGGGALFNLTPHQIDHLLFLTDAKVLSVNGCINTLRPGVNTDTDCTALIEFENGVHATIGSFSSTRAVDPPRLECRLLGTNGSMTLQAFKPEIMLCVGAEREVIDCSKDIDPIDLEWLELYESIVSGKPCESNGEYGHNVVAVLEAIRESYKKKQAISPKWI